MPSEAINEYYDVTKDREVRAGLMKAVELVTSRFTDVTAIDCGCGAGRDIEYLNEQGFTVHGFDLEAESIERCRSRFADHPNVHLTQSSFTDFEYPEAQLITADASLFFCPANDFPVVWQKISTALSSGGVFIGGFLGERDTMASDQYDPDKFWPDVMTVNEASLRSNFSLFSVLNFVEHELDGKTAQGEDHHWHIFEVMLEKQ